MAQDSATPSDTSSKIPGSPLTAAIIQTVREAEHISVAIDVQEATLVQAGIWPGARLTITVPSGEYEFHYHGTGKAWRTFRQVFGHEAEEAMRERPGIGAYLEYDRTMGGRRIEGHSEWLRLRASIGGTKVDSPLFSTPEGTVGELRVITPGALPTKLPAAKLKKGELLVQVLASHSRAMTLSVDGIAVRKLKGKPDCWYELQVGDIRLPIRSRRGIDRPIEEEVWNTPNALLFDYESHWANERLTVMLLQPMQWNWKGRYPDWDSVHIPEVPEHTAVTLRLAPDGD